MQTAGYLVGIVVELTAGVQHGHDDFRCRSALFRVHVNRNAPAVIRDRHGFVRVDRYRDLTAKTCQRLVDRVVDDLENHVVKTRAVIGVADVHARPFAHGFEAL